MDEVPLGCPLKRVLGLGDGVLEQLDPVNHFLFFRLQPKRQLGLHLADR